MAYSFVLGVQCRGWSVEHRNITIALSLPLYSKAKLRDPMQANKSDHILVLVIAATPSSS